MKTAPFFLSRPHFLVGRYGGGQTVADTQKNYFENVQNLKDLAPLLKIPKFYMLGVKPICSYYDTFRGKDFQKNVNPWDTVYMLYIPAQEAVSARQLKNGNTEAWDLRDRDRIACCSLSLYRSPWSGGQAMKCAELDASDPDVLDMAD